MYTSEEGSLMLPGGNAGSIPQKPEVPIGTPTTLSPIVDQRSPPRKLSRQNDGGSGQNLSLNAWGDPQLLDGMAEVTVERVTRTQQRYKPEAATLRNQVGHYKLPSYGHNNGPQRKYHNSVLNSNLARAISKFKHEMYEM